MYLHHPDSGTVKDNKDYPQETEQLLQGSWKSLHVAIRLQSGLPCIKVGELQLKDMSLGSKHGKETR